MPEVVVALLTPFDASNNVALGALESHAEYLLERGITALMPCGTTGEGVLLDDDEVTRIVGHLVRIAHGRARVLAHAGRASTRATIGLARAVLDAGADAISAVTPYYFKYGDAQLREHYLALLRAVSAPLYAYTIPERTGNTLSADVVRQLGEAGLAGVKDSTKSIEAHREYLACGIDVLMGSDALVLDAFRLGAAGAVSAVANVDPRSLLEIAASVALDQSPPAAEAQARLNALRDRTRRATSTIAGLKRELAARLPGYPVHTRAPLA
ncbi:MAG: dihydrodipicolinate synthase family protein [Gemmatimonadaceae bacterium]